MQIIICIESIAVARLENPPNLPAWIDSGGPRRARGVAQKESSSLLKSCGAKFCQAFW